MQFFLTPPSRKRSRSAEYGRRAELRRRGYGRCVVAASLLDARAQGVEKAILFTGESNLAAQRAYTALGFRHIGDYRLLLLQSPMLAEELSLVKRRRSVV